MNGLKMQLRAVFRRFGLGERRWIPDDADRDAHLRVVDRRLPNNGIDPIARDVGSSHRAERKDNPVKAATPARRRRRRSRGRKTRR